MSLKALWKTVATKVGFRNSSSSVTSSSLESELNFESEVLEQFPKRVVGFSSQYGDGRLF